MTAPVPKTLLRKVMRYFPTGVMVLTVCRAGETHAMTANAVISVALEPPLVLVSIDKSARTHALVQAARVFALSLLSEQQAALARRFAFDREAKRNPALHTPLLTAVTGCPILAEAPGYLDCRVTAEYDGADHTLFLGEVLAAHVDPHAPGPLLYFQSRFHGLGPDVDR